MLTRLHDRIRFTWAEIVWHFIVGIIFLTGLTFLAYSCQEAHGDVVCGDTGNCYGNLIPYSPFMPDFHPYKQDEVTKEIEQLKKDVKELREEIKAMPFFEHKDKYQEITIRFKAN